MNKSKRVTRKPLMNKGPLIESGRAGYTRRWVNLHGSNYEQALELGYQVVANEKLREGTKVKDDSDSLSTAVVKTVNESDGLQAVLMECPNEIYEERQMAKQEEVDSSEEALRPDQNPNHYGSIKIREK